MCIYIYTYIYIHTEADEAEEGGYNTRVTARFVRGVTNRT